MLQVPVPAGFSSCLCPTCRGTGMLGRSTRFESIGDSVIVLTRTRWCETCKSAGQVWVESENQSELQRICYAAANEFTAAEVVAKAS